MKLSSIVWIAAARLPAPTKHRTRAWRAREAIETSGSPLAIAAQESAAAEGDWLSSSRAAIQSGRAATGSAATDPLKEGYPGVMTESARP
ncbi:MAG TPA: hypothetical protein VHC90_01975 [Bryobacteraceae bacterium]|nr:hypothetical protein [Bryobacteraceae bacterium]